MDPLRYRLNYAWRVFGTGLSFACFGLGGIVISVTLFPLIRLVSWDAGVRRRRIQRAMSATMRLFVWLMRTLGVISYEVHGGEKLRMPGQLVVANHPSLIDVVLIISFMPEVDCIVKQGLWRNPFLRWPVAWAGYIPNTEPERLVEQCAGALQAGRSLIVFPEGTRTVPGQAMSMKRGAAQIALAAGCDIRPVSIHVAPLMLTKGAKWYRVPPRPGHWRIEVGDAIRPGDFVQAGEGPAVAARRLTRHFMDYFSRRAPAAAPV
jgi:1-acyl-sn-glycerol-3-phosphate acyltransferase